MLTYAIVMFGIAAFGGATLAYLRFARKSIPLPLAIIHGFFAATGLVLLTLGTMRVDRRGIAAALIIYFIAAIGGFTLFSFQLRSRPLPIPLVLIHGAVAVTAFITSLLNVV